MVERYERRDPRAVSNMSRPNQNPRNDLLRHLLGSRCTTGHPPGYSADHVAILDICCCQVPLGGRVGAVTSGRIAMAHEWRTLTDAMSSGFGSPGNGIGSIGRAGSGSGLGSPGDGGIGGGLGSGGGMVKDGSGDAPWSVCAFMTLFVPGHC